jgi:hypothetical protein
MEKFAIINRIEGRVTRDKMYFQMGEEGNPPDAYELHTTKKMQRLLFRDFTISNRYPNNVVLVEHDGVSVVTNIVYSNDTFIVSIVPFVTQTDFFETRPCNSTDFDIYLVTDGLKLSARKDVDSSMTRPFSMWDIYVKNIDFPKSDLH